MKPSVCIYVYWDKSGILNKFAERSIVNLFNFFDRLIVVVNGELDKPGINKLLQLGVEFIIRPNVGYDFTAYAAGIEKIGYRSLNQYDKLIICNSSVYGPFFSMHKMFHEMQSKEIDFWGITQWSNHPPHKDHIQSYFVVFNNKIISSKSFSDYWKSIPKIDSWNDAIKHGEVKLTEYFARLGFKWSTFIDSKVLKGFHPCPFLAYPTTLLKLGVPFLKRKVFTIEYYEQCLAFSEGKQASEVLDYLAAQYPEVINEIIEDITKNQMCSSALQALSNTYILPDSCSSTNNEICFDIIIISESGFLSRCLFDRLNHLNFLTLDVYIYTRVNTDHEYSECSIEGVYVKYIKYDDTIDLLNKLKEYRTSKEYVCILFDIDESSYSCSKFREKTITEHSLDSLLYSSSYIKNIFDLLDSKKYLGILSQIEYDYWNVVNFNAKENVIKKREFLKHLNVESDCFSDSQLSGNKMFWSKARVFNEISNMTYLDNIENVKKMKVDQLISLFPLLGYINGTIFGEVLYQKAAYRYYSNLRYILKSQDSSSEHAMKLNLNSENKPFSILKGHIRKVFKKFRIK